MTRNEQQMYKDISALTKALTRLVKLLEKQIIHTRALNYTDKDCYTKTDVELIVFGKVVDYDKK
jgi:hypothetical protein